MEKKICTSIELLTAFWVSPRICIVTKSPATLVDYKCKNITEESLRGEEHQSPENAHEVCGTIFLRYVKWRKPIRGSLGRGTISSVAVSRKRSPSHPPARVP
jgi:hypothetical protein